MPIFDIQDADGRVKLDELLHEYLNDSSMVEFPARKK